MRVIQTSFNYFCLRESLVAANFYIVYLYVDSTFFPSFFLVDLLLFKVSEAEICFSCALKRVLMEFYVPFVLTYN